MIPAENISFAVFNNLIATSSATTASLHFGHTWAGTLLTTIFVSLRSRVTDTVPSASSASLQIKQSLIYVSYGLFSIYPGREYRL